MHEAIQRLVVPTISPETYEYGQCHILRSLGYHAQIMIVHDRAVALQAEFLAGECDRYERQNAYTLRQLEDQRENEGVLVEEEEL